MSKVFTAYLEDDGVRRDFIIDTGKPIKLIHMAQNSGVGTYSDDKSGYGVSYAKSLKRISTDKHGSSVPKLQPESEWKYIGSADSIVTKNKVDIYYNLIEKLLFILPTPTTFLNNLESVVGHTIIYGAIVKDENRPLIGADVNSQDRVFDNVEVIDTTHTEFIMLPELRKHSQLGYHERMVTDVDSIQSPGLNGIQFICLGSADDVFGTSNDTPIKIQHLEQTGFMKMELTKPTMTSVKDILIMLDF